MFEVNVKDGKVFLFNEYGLVYDLSEATLVVAENGEALRAYIESMGDYDDDMNRDEQKFCDAVENAFGVLHDTAPVGFQFAYRQGRYSEEFIRMPDTMATALWLSRNAIN